MSKKKKEKECSENTYFTYFIWEKQRQNMHSRNAKQSNSSFCSKQDVSSAAQMDFVFIWGQWSVMSPHKVFMVYMLCLYFTGNGASR